MQDATRRRLDVLIVVGILFAGWAIIIAIVLFAISLSARSADAQTQQYCHLASGGCFAWPPAIGLQCSAAGDVVNSTPCPAATPTPTATPTAPPVPTAPLAGTFGFDPGMRSPCIVYSDGAAVAGVPACASAHYILGTSAQIPYATSGATVKALAMSTAPAYPWHPVYRKPTPAAGVHALAMTTTAGQDPAKWLTTTVEQLANGYEATVVTDTTVNPSPDPDGWFWTSWQDNRYMGGDSGPARTVGDNLAVAIRWRHTVVEAGASPDEVSCGGMQFTFSLPGDPSGRWAELDISFGYTPPARPDPRPRYFWVAPLGTFDPGDHSGPYYYVVLDGAGWGMPDSTTGRDYVIPLSYMVREAARENPSLFPITNTAQLFGFGPVTQQRYGVRNTMAFSGMTGLLGQPDPAAPMPTPTPTPMAASGQTWTAEVNEQFGSVVVTAACGALPCTITATRSGVGGFMTTSIDSGPAWGTVALGPIYPLYVQIANRGVPMPSMVTAEHALTVMGYQIDPYGKWQVVPFRRQAGTP